MFVCAGALTCPAQAKQDKNHKKQQALLQELQEAAAREVGSSRHALGAAAG